MMLPFISIIACCRFLQRDQKEIYENIFLFVYNILAALRGFWYYVRIYFPSEEWMTSIPGRCSASYIDRVSYILMCSNMHIIYDSLTILVFPWLPQSVYS